MSWADVHRGTGVEFAHLLLGPLYFALDREYHGGYTFTVLVGRLTWKVRL